MKGHTFTEADLPATARARWTPDRKAAWCKEQTERYRIVAKMGDTPLIAEEVEQRIINSFPSAVRRIVGTLARLPAADRRAVFDAFDRSSGELKNPFQSP